MSTKPGQVQANTKFNLSNPGTTWQWNIAVRDIVFDNNAPGNPNGNDAAIYFQGVNGVSIERCKVFSCNSHAISVQSTLNTGPAPQGNVRILNNTLDVLATRASDGTLKTGIFPIRVWALDGVLIDGNIIGFNPPSSWSPTWSNDAMDTPACSNTVITNNIMTWCTDGIGTNTTGNVIISKNVVVNFIGVGISSFAIGGGGSNQFIIDSNVVIATQPAQAGILGYQVSPTGIRTTTPASGDIVSNNTLYGPFGTSAISLEAPQGVCTGNVIDLQGTATGGPYPSNGIKVVANDLTINDNTIRNGQGLSASAINIFGPPVPANLVITSNNIFNCQTNLLASAGLPTNSRISGNLGINPYGAFLALNPPIPTSGVAFVNPFPFDCMVYVSGGTGLGVTVHGVITGLGAGSYFVPVNENITLNYAAAPTWKWIAN